MTIQKIKNKIFIWFILLFVLIGIGENSFAKANNFSICFYKDGEFLQQATMAEYIEMMIPFASQAGMTPQQMRKFCEEVYPTLKRWKK